MRVDLPVADTWYAANERAREALGIPDDPNIAVQVYLGTRHALWEVTQALAQTYPHRRTIGYAPFTGPEAEFVALQFAKEGFTVKSLTQEEFNSPKPWLESAGKQTLCILSAFDDPATGELYQAESHVAALKDQRIFRILISHSYHLTYPVGKVDPYDVQIISLKSDLAVAILGERAKLSPPIASNLSWHPGLSFERLKTRSATDVEEAKKIIGEFTNSASSVGSVYSCSNVLHDRVLLLVSEIEGLSFVTRLAEKLSLTVGEPGADTDLETLSVCRWQDPRQLEWLSSKGLTVEKLRGSVIISADLVRRTGVGKLVQALQETKSSLLADQG